MTPINQSDSNELDVLTPKSLVKAQSDNELEQLLELMQKAPLEPFAEIICRFLKTFSKILLQQPNPELMAVGFWIRESQVKRWRNTYQNSQGGQTQVQPLGNVLHFTPANVDTMFVYSWVCALMMGNISILRLSGQGSEVKQSLLKLINELYEKEEYQEIASRNCFIYYPHNYKNTSSLSAGADARILWGGDEAVMNIRAIPANPRTRDIGFADRYSVSLVNGAALTTTEQVNELAQKIWKDAFPYGQMACSSPKAIFWMGSTAQQQALFETINALAIEEHRALNHKTDHLITTQLVQAEGLAGSTRFSDAITVINIEKTTDSLFNWHTGNGLFYIKQIDNVENVFSELDRKCQTLSYWGVDKQVLIKHLAKEPITPIDRVVPIGQSLDFDPVWDGYDLMQQLCRKITIL